ncbi:MAG: hypothetical protein JWN65_3916 [Solirubrobacterales bacterium]|nr:hypothetical protein [Solirubrobacterales bacterium]
MATPQPPRRRRPPLAPRKHRPLPRGPKISRARGRLAVLLALPLLAVLSTVALRLAYTDRALPGTQLSGTNVEGDTRSALRERMTRLKASPITILAAGRQLRVTPATAGYELDVEATLDRVLDAGRDGALGGLVNSAKGLFVTRDVRPVARIDRAALTETAKSFARLVNRPAYPGGVSVDPVGLAVTVQGPRQGRTVDRAVLETRLVAALRAGRTQLKAPLRSTRVASLADAQRVGRAAGRYLRQPLILTGAGGPPSVVTADRLAPILRLRASSRDHTQVRLGSEEPALRRLVAQIADDRDRPARSAQLSAPGRTAILDGKGSASWRPRKADVRVIREARTGRTVQRERALEAIAAAVREGRHRVKLPVTTATPKVSAKAARHIDSLIGTFTTRYEAGQPRVTNIRRMARTVDGTLIAPGAQFSLNGIVGQRTEKDGYVKAPYIADGKIVPSVGGGVSQFSTTMYNAAYFAGLKVDTHQPHSLYISRYPPGREATLNYPDIDLRWTNDTQTPILVRTFTDVGSVTVSLYGDNGGRRVTAKPGPRTAVPGGDFQIKVVRTVRYPDGRSVEDAFTTKYDKSAE